MSDIYCGCKSKILKGKVKGTMKQCAELGQIRSYGLSKIDKILAESVQNNSELKANLITKKRSLQGSYVSVVGKMKKLQTKIDAEKNKTEKQNLQNELNKLSSQKDKINNELKSIVI